MTLLERANGILRENYLVRMRRSGATGWESATIADVRHLHIGDPETVAALLAIEEWIGEVLA